MARVNLEKAVYDEMIKFAGEGVPNEVGGFVLALSGDGSKQKLVPVDNVAATPQFSYAGQARQTIKVFELVGETHGSIIMIWHSHPSAGAVPSEIDKGFYHPARFLGIVDPSPGALQLRVWDVLTWREVDYAVV